MRAVSRRGAASASPVRKLAVRLASATNWPWTWQARMRSISITGVWLASARAETCFTPPTHHGKVRRAAGDPARRQVGERVGGDVHADGPLEGDRAAQRVVDRSRERRRGGGLAR